MIKLIKSLFPLCILLLSGYFQQHGHTFYESISGSSVKNGNDFIGEKSQYSVSKPVFFTTKQENKHNHITDIEGKEDEVVSFKKYLPFSDNIHTVFYPQLAEHLFQYTQIHSFFFKQFSYYPSRKSLYLIFEVMRI